jgi:hypothetical protein
MDWLGILAIAFFYALIYVVGVIAGKKTNKRRMSVGGQTEEVFFGFHPFSNRQFTKSAKKLKITKINFR